MLNGIIGIVKATLAIALLTLLLGACATPYYPVYTNDSGDYYVAEKGSSGAYYGSGSSGYRPRLPGCTSLAPACPGP